MQLTCTANVVFLFCFRYLGSGCYYMDLHYMYRIGTTTASYIVPVMCRMLWISLSSDVFPAFTEDFWRQTAEGFKTRAYFPHCIGAVDCKHIRMIKPEHSGSLFYNYKSYFSIVLLAIADSNYKLLYVDVGSMGKDADPTIFDCSSFGKAFYDGSLNIPSTEKISNSSSPLPYVLVGDEAFGIDVNLMRPFPGRNLTKSTRIFNYRLSSARRFVECTFGILTNKWRIFHRPMNLKLNNTIHVVKAACVLHNYVRERDGFLFQDTLEITGLYNIQHDESQRITITRGNKAAYRYRNDFVSYFNSSEGRVPWQDDKV